MSIPYRWRCPPNPWWLGDFKACDSVQEVAWIFLIDFSNISYVKYVNFSSLLVFSLWGLNFCWSFSVRSWDLSLEYQGFSDVDHVYNYSLLVLAEFQKFCSWFHGAWSFFFFGWSFDLRAGVLKVLKILQDHHRTLFGGLPLVGVGRDGVARQNSDLTSSFTSILHPPSSIVLPRLRWRLGASNVAQTGKSKPAKAAKVADDVSHSNVASWLKKTWDHMSSRAGKVGSECK